VFGLLIFAVMECIVAFLLLDFWFFELFALLGTTLVLTPWLYTFIFFRMVDDSSSGVEVRLNNRLYRLTGGQLFYGFFGVTVLSQVA